MTKQPRFTGSIFLAFGALSLLFVCSTLLANWFSYEIEVRTEAASTDALPSIVRLIAACDALRDLEAASDEYPDLADEQHAAARKAIDQKWRLVDAELAAYVALPAYSGERELYESKVPAALREVDMALAHLFTEVDAHQTAAARATADREVRVATNRAVALLRNMITFNATHAQDDLNSIFAIHRSASRRAMLLDALALLCGAVVAFWVFRRFKAHDKLLADHNALVEQRAAELEVFGQRVAHDLLSPLSALTYCLGAFKRPSEGDPKLQEALTRARSCVARAQGMVHGIFEFARAGGNPESLARADLGEVVDQITDDVRTGESGEEMAVIVEPFETCDVACAPGVLTSVLSNLLRNAVKYMSDSAFKQITVRVCQRDSYVRVEVEDTGPGIPPGLEERIFEPYLRAEGVTQAGLGLGLATVKRLCEAHGGKVGVRSKPGQGSVFWFTLPKSSGAAEAIAPESAAKLRSLR